jgi:hypothetical protein
MHDRARLLVAVALAFSAPFLGACAPTRPPFTAASVPSAADPHAATVVFLWPSTSCDTGGYYTLADADGKFVGNIAAGTQLTVPMAAGDHTLVGWNGSHAEADDAASMVSVPVLHATLEEGRTYYVRLAFGEWDDKGPRQMHMIRTARRVCFRIGNVMSTAMVTLTPASEEWSELSAWTSELQPTSSDAAAGQSWLDANQPIFTMHRDLAKTRFDALHPRAKGLATLQASDGVAAAH